MGNDQTSGVGIPYSVFELERAAMQAFDVYHRDLMLWAAREIRRLEYDVKRLTEGR